MIELTIDRLMALHYPADALRVYVVDDASTDATPSKVIAKTKQYPNRVFHLRRVAGGEGKAHTLNYGLETLWRSSWAQAVLIMDADVIYTPDSLLRMARHLADPEVGAVTAYIKEGSADPNYIQRFIGFEYITATGASRRAQNVLGFLACLSGGAQLHSRENLEAIGGEIYAHTLAEDTFTTFRTQLGGRRAIFDPNAVVYAEEPDNLDGLWKQRIRWGRGNVQISREFRSLWFNPRKHPTMGSWSMGLLWFSIFLMPALQIAAATGLITLYFVDHALSWQVFRGFWIVAGIVYLVVTLVSFVTDTESAARTWAEGILFPGLVSLGIISYSLLPPVWYPVLDFLDWDPNSTLAMVSVLCLYAWQVVAMIIAYLAKAIEVHCAWLRGWVSPILLYFAGFGAFLCAVTFGAYMKELRGESMAWDKTVKTGKVG